MYHKIPSTEVTEKTEGIEAGPAKEPAGTVADTGGETAGHRQERMFVGAVSVRSIRTVKYRINGKRSK